MILGVPWRSVVAEQRGDVVVERRRNLRQPPERDVRLAALDGAEERGRDPSLRGQATNRESTLAAKAPDHVADARGRGGRDVSACHRGGAYSGPCV